MPPKYVFNIASLPIAIFQSILENISGQAFTAMISHDDIELCSYRMLMAGVEKYARYYSIPHTRTNINTDARACAAP